MPSLSAFSFSRSVIQRSTYLHEREEKGTPAPYAVNDNTLGKRLEKLRKAQPLLGPTLERFYCHSQAVQDGIEPRWVRFVEQLITPNDPVGSSFAGSQKLHEDCSRQAFAFPFRQAVENFLIIVAASLKDVVSPDAEEEIYSNLSEWYLKRLIETSRYVLHLSYTQSRASYWQWCDKFLSSDHQINPWYSIAQEFPVLLRWLERIDRNCKEVVAETVARLQTDREDLESGFGIEKSDKLSNIVPGLSDPHNGGRTVLRLCFCDGMSIVYKPKPLHIDSALYAYAAKNNIGVVALKVITKNCYGWVEDASHITVSESTHKKSPECLGKAAATFWMLNATDLHSENVVPTARGIYVWDLETLLTSPLEPGTDSSNNLAIWRSHTIYTTLLFDFSFGPDQKANISGFDPSASFENLTPQIYFSIEGQHIKVSSQAPESLTQSPEPTPHLEAYSTQDLIRNFRGATAPSVRARLETFVRGLSDNIVRRAVFRDTNFYLRLLERLRQPRFLRDGATASLDLLTLHLAAPSSSTQGETIFRLVNDEIKQLLDGDIPYFSSTVGSKKLRLSDQVIDDFFAETSNRFALRKIQGLESSDIEEQVSLIEIALDKRPTCEAGAIANEIQIKTTQYSSDEFGLEEIALETMVSGYSPSGLPTRWISMYGDTSGRESRIDVGETGFFGGSWGILLALQAIETALSANLPLDRIRRFLDREAKLWRDLLRHEVNFSDSPLGFSGIGGNIFAQSVLVGLDEDRWSFLVPHIGMSVENAIASIKTDSWLDIMGGSAGLALGCEQFLLLENSSSRRELAEKAQRMCGLHLVDTAVTMDVGKAWLVPGQKSPLLGYAHGISGITVALRCVLNRSTDESDLRMIRETLGGAIDLIDHLYEENQKWYDYRSFLPASQPLNKSWCNGTPGLIRGLLELRRDLSEGAEEGLRALLDQTFRNLGRGDVYRFCCGEIGNVDLLLDFSRTLPEVEGNRMQSIAREVTKKVLSVVRGNKGTRFVPEIELPGLFHGKAGMLYVASRFLLPNLPSLSGQNIAMPNNGKTKGLSDFP